MVCEIKQHDSIDESGQRHRTVNIIMDSYIHVRKNNSIII
jgi:hypothetical protein